MHQNKKKFKNQINKTEIKIKSCKIYSKIIVEFIFDSQVLLISIDQNQTFVKISSGSEERFW